MITRFNKYSLTTLVQRGVKFDLARLFAVVDKTTRTIPGCERVFFLCNRVSPLRRLMMLCYRGKKTFWHPRKRPIPTNRHPSKFSLPKWRQEQCKVCFHGPVAPQRDRGAEIRSGRRLLQSFVLNTALIPGHRLFIRVSMFIVRPGHLISHGEGKRLLCACVERVLCSLVLITVRQKLIQSLLQTLCAKWVVA